MSGNDKCPGCGEARTYAPNHVVLGPNGTLAHVTGSMECLCRQLAHASVEARKDKEKLTSALQVARHLTARLTQSQADNAALLLELLTHTGRAFYNSGRYWCPLCKCEHKAGEDHAPLWVLLRPLGTL